MSRVIYTWLNLVWGLWFGGLVMLFLAVQWLFKAFAEDRPVASLAAATIFRQFNRYRLYLAAAALLLIAYAWLRDRMRLQFTLFGVVALAALAAVYTTGVLTPHLEAMRQQGLAHSDEFRRLHGQSMAIYMTEALLILIAGVLLPATRKPPAV